MCRTSVIAMRRCVTPGTYVTHIAGAGSRAGWPTSCSIDYETGTVTTLKPKANPRFEGSSSEPAAVWEEIPRNDDPHWSYEILPRTVTPIEADTAA